MDAQKPLAKRRGAQVHPTNRFERLEVIEDFDHLEFDDEIRRDERVVPTEFYDDVTQGVIAENDSPDLHFRYSVNPYRGCEHGCAYCYARPYHEYLGMNAGLDFETKIMVKRESPRLLREWLARPGWKCEPIMLSGVTDCYQPIERSLGITRACLEVMLEARQPVEIISKSRLILRDKDLLEELARRRLVHVTVAVTTLDFNLAREMEPRAAAPIRRLEVIETLTKVGVPVRLLLAPVIPGLTDSEMPAILAAGAKAGAVSAGYVLLRLPGAVRPVFLDWLERMHPLKRSRVEQMIRETRGGRLSDPRFGSRMRGEGTSAEGLEALFNLFRRKHGLDRSMPRLDIDSFRPPTLSNGQQWLF